MISKKQFVDLLFGKAGTKKKEDNLFDEIDDKSKNKKKNPTANPLGPIVPRPMPQNFEVIERYPLAPPYAFAVIAQDPEEKIPQYFVDEVLLSETEKTLYGRIIKMLQYEVKAPRVEVNPREYFAEEAQSMVDRYRLKTKWSEVSWPLLLYYAERDMVGFGALEPMMRDANIEDISLDSVKKPVFIYHKRYESLPSNLVFSDDEELDDAIVRLVHMSGKHVSTAFPIVDATLPGKHRLAATFRKEVTPLGSSLTIRKFREDPITVIDLINFKTLDYASAAYAWLLLENRATSVIVGATASGKTTFLNALLSMVNPTSKILTIEEVQEINIHHENWEPLVSRLSYGLTEETAGEISLFQLVKAAMRMRPDILVVGEIRGEEAYALFQAISTGHGGLATLHADNAGSAIQRLISKPMDVAPAYINFLDLVFSVRRVSIPNSVDPDNPKFVRRLISIDEVMSAEKTQCVFSWEPKTDSYVNHLSDSMKLRSLGSDKGKSIDDMMEEIQNRMRVLRWLVAKKIRNFVEVSTIFSQYHSDPDSVLSRIEQTEGEEESQTGRDLISWRKPKETPIQTKITQESPNPPGRFG